MGGFGSGDWYRYGKKLTVEACCSIDVLKMQREGSLVSGRRGTITWTFQPSGKPAGSVSYRVESTIDDDLAIRFSYRLVDSGEVVNRSVTVEPTYPKYGGLRYWFRCPRLIDGRMPCWRRATKLYLPRGAHLFGCRQCFGLTYRSCQEAHREERIMLHCEKLVADFEARRGLFRHVARARPERRMVGL